MRIRQVSTIISSVVLLLVCTQPGIAKLYEGHLVVHVNPKQAFVYADSEPVVESLGHFIRLTPGQHRIDLYNFGYKPETRMVTIESHKTLHLNVTMQPIPGMISGPWGCITIEGPVHTAVLLNGKDPSIFFVGHVDEFDNEWVWKQELIVPPGKHQLTLEYLERNPWSTTVEVKANQRVVVDAYKGVRKTVAWPRGEQLKEMPRFKPGIASTEVVVEKVGGRFSASTDQVNCGGAAQLDWSSSGAPKRELNGKPVAASGDLTVQPHQTTDYKFTAAGPGGVYTSDATVKVDKAVTASLSVSPADVRLNPTGGSSGEESPTLTWSAANAESVTVDPLGPVGTSGSREVQIPSAKNAAGETVTYTLHASNACGGSVTRTATLRIEGPQVANLETKLSINSVYFPTAWPTVQDPQEGLLPSQKSRLEANASDFKQYMAFRPDAKLILGGHADHRGSDAYNQALSQRRADLVKSYLVKEGVPADKIETRAYGKKRNLTGKEVNELAAENPNITPEERRRVLHNIVLFRLANNRRVDIRLSTGLTSQRFYPYNSADLKVLLEEKEPSATQLASLK